jgi:Domain of unknown function (DUF4345)
VLALIPVATGAVGLLLVSRFPAFGREWPVGLDSHFRFLSAMFLAIGAAFLTYIPRIEHKTVRFRLLAALVFCGGLGRLLSYGVMGPPSSGHIAGLGMELVVVPTLVLFHPKISLIWS